MFTCTLRSFFTAILLALVSWLPAQPFVVQACTLTTYAPNDHAVWLNSLPGDPSRDYVFGPDGGSMVIFNDSTAQVTGEIVHESDTSRRWEVEFWMIREMDYLTWTGLGRGLKNGGNANQTEQEDWLFWELDSTRSRMIGIGSVYAGDTLQLLHNPPSLQYGFQLGIGANDKNGNFGLSGWFLFEGSYSGRGDLNVNVECDSVPPPPPPICEISIDTFYASCKTDSTFEMVVAFSGIGDNFTITDDQNTAPMDSLSPGLHFYGEYLNSIDVMLTIADTNFVACIDGTPPVTADCTPVAICDLVVDSVTTECLSDSTFGLVVSLSGSSSLYQLSDDLGSVPLDNLSAGTYSYGEYVSDTSVTLWVIDQGVFNCFEFLGPFTDSCSTDSVVMEPVARVVSGAVYPNPVRGRATLQLHTEEAGLQMECLLVDGMGRVRSREQMRLSQGDQQLDMNWEGFQPGLYFLRLVVGEELISAQRILISD